MNTITISGLDVTMPFKQLEAIIRQLQPKQRFILFREFEDEYYRFKFKELLKDLRKQNSDITFDEITEEVESVRQERYAKKIADQGCN